MCRCEGGGGGYSTLRYFLLCLRCWIGVRVCGVVGVGVRGYFVGEVGVSVIFTVCGVFALLDGCVGGTEKCWVGIFFV